MKPHPSTPAWVRDAAERPGPIYRALLDALREAIASGELPPGEQLPPQRAVAEQLGVDFTTVTRAYTAAKALGLVEGTVGRGTFVRRPAEEMEGDIVDLTMNLPPPPEGRSLSRLLQESSAALLARTDVATLMSYHPGAGTLGQRRAGADWLAPVLGQVAPDRVLVCPGAQTGLAASLAALARSGDVVVTEPLTYPGVRGAASHLGLGLAPCEADAEGLRPDALDRLCRERRPAALYIVPTMQNPTAVHTSLSRRREIVRIARAHDLWIVEDDPYSRLLDSPLPALAALAPERTVHLATLSKCLSPGLRIAYAVCPAGEGGARVAEALRGFALMPSPLVAAVVTDWMRAGVAEDLLQGVRAETRARRAIAAEALPEAVGDPASLHVWLDLPQAWSLAALRSAAQTRGLALVASDAFAVGEQARTGVRISLGGPARRQVLVDALASVRGMLEGQPGSGALLV